MGRQTFYPLSYRGSHAIKAQCTFQRQIIIILGQKSNDTNHCPYVQGTQYILELNQAYVCLGGTKEQNAQKMSTHTYPHNVICQYLIGENWDAVGCCACASIDLYCIEKSIMQESRKTLCPIFSTQVLHAKFKFFKFSD